MKIKIAVWNMAYWSHKNLLEEAWDYFLNKVDADFYLFQEARPPQAILNNKDNLVWSEIGENRQWGSGIYSKKHHLTEEKIKTDYEGVFSIANTKVNEIPLTLISIYGLMTETYSITNLHRMLSDLTPIFNGHVNGRRNIILGGDLNASLQIDAMQKSNSHKIFFDRLEDFGLYDCFKLTDKKFPVQTLRHHTSSKPWQNDYLFVGKKLSSGVISCDVLNNEEIRKYSDHNIVVSEFDL